MTKDMEMSAAAPSGAAGGTIPAISAKGRSAAKALLAFTAEPRAKHITVVGALIAVAALTGAVGGGLAVTGFMRATETVEPMATLYDTRMLQGAITVLRAEFMELKAGVEADASRTNAQLAKLEERFARIDRPKTARETTGSVNRCRTPSKDGSCVTPATTQRSPSTVGSARPK